MYKQKSEFMSVQKKLVGAVAMVLVACIMVVSSSYAWFTLSTAPEVKGIQTSVGSNGNLEMALRDEAIPLNAITTTNQSSSVVTETNVFWGNLVDLSDVSYGLSNIALQPARLSWSDASGKINNGYLTVPTYGVDGRISGWTTVESGKLNTNDQFQVGDYAGVRGLGTVSGLSAGQIALRDAITAMTTSRDVVASLAKKSLEEDAINLANLIIANKMNNKATLNASEWAQVTAAVDNLENIAAKLENTMITVVKAVAVAQNVDLTDKTITFTASGATVADVTGLEIPDDLQTGLGAAYTTLSSMDGKLDAANQVIGGVQDTSAVPYATVESVMTSILSINDILVDGQSLDGKNENDLVGIVVDAYTENEGKLPIDVQSGIYKEITDFIGTYSAQKQTTIDVSGFGDVAALFPNGVKITLQMRANTAAPAVPGAYYLPYFVTQLNLLQAHDAGNGGVQVISDLYAFAVDMAFRTNAENSSLMLQTDAVSRVGDDTTANVQGAGSYMQFTKGTDDERYTIEQMKELMGAIRVVLYNTETKDICGIAVLDMTAAETDGDTVKAPLYLHNYTLNLNQSLEVGAKIAADTNGKTELTDLNQNEAFGLTALVYMDGDQVENADVAIEGNSMTGTLNLQFSSSADLKPMDYTFTTN